MSARTTTQLARIIGSKALPSGKGIEVRLGLPAPLAFDFGHATGHTLQLVLWLRDPELLEDPETPTVEMFGLFNDLELTRDSLYRLETWTGTEQLTVDQALATSEFLADRGLHFTTKEN